MHNPHESQELNDIERLLSSIPPSSAGLHTDAMLFAAGLAAGKARKAMPVYSVLCGVLMLTVAGLACWGLVERRELMQIAHNQPQNDRPPNVAVIGELEPAKSIYEPSAADYLSLRREMEADPNRFLVTHAAVSSQPPDAPPPSVGIFTAGQRSGVLD